MKVDGSQYKKCIKCRNNKIKKPEEEIPDCCEAELIRDTSKKLNCEIVYPNDLNFMMDLDSGLARACFNTMIKTKNFVIIEAITVSNCCPLMDLLY